MYETRPKGIRSGQANGGIGREAIGCKVGAGGCGEDVVEESECVGCGGHVWQGGASAEGGTWGAAGYVADDGNGVGLLGSGTQLGGGVKEGEPVGLRPKGVCLSTAEAVNATADEGRKLRAWDARRWRG